MIFYTLDRDGKYSLTDKLKRVNALVKPKYHAAVCLECAFRKLYFYFSPDENWCCRIFRSPSSALRLLNAGSLLIKRFLVADRILSIWASAIAEGHSLLLRILLASFAAFVAGHALALSGVSRTIDMLPSRASILIHVPMRQYWYQYFFRSDCSSGIDTIDNKRAINEWWSEY